MTKLLRNPELKAFTKWYLNQPGLTLKVPERNALKMMENSTEFVLYRDGQIQVEFIFIRGGVAVPPHIHPNVDTYEVPWHGDEAFAHVEGRLYPPNEPGDRTPRFIPLAFGAMHSAWPGNGLALLSIQAWLNGVPPTFITDDWVGESWS